MAGGAVGVKFFARGQVRVIDHLGVSEGGEALQPLRKLFFRFNHHRAAHGVVSQATQFFAENIELALAGRLKPLVGFGAGYQIHFHAKLRHGKIVQHVVRAKIEFYRLIQW